MIKKLLTLLVGLVLLVPTANAMESNAQQKLFKAAREADIALLDEAILKGADINALSDDPFKMNALHRILDNEKQLTKEETAFLNALPSLSFFLITFLIMPIRRDLLFGGHYIIFNFSSRIW